MTIASTVRLSFPQRAALSAMMNATGPLDPRRMGARRDVLWRLADKGYARETLHGQWTITSAGITAYEAWWAQNGRSDA